MKIYTRTGDDGSTSLRGGKRLPKHNLRIEASGTIEELMAWMGLLRDTVVNADQKEILFYIQNQLMSSASALSAINSRQYLSAAMPDENCVSVIEAEINKMELRLSPLRKFIIPGGNKVVSYCHIVRCVCRRAERAVLRLNSEEYTPEIVHIFLNRLSNYLFALSRILSLELDIEEVTWSL